MKLVTQYENVTQKVLFWIVFSQNFLTCIFLGDGLGVMGQYRGLRAHPILLHLISSCEDTLRTLFTRALCPPPMN
jgi:hypothetical protein